MIDMHVHTWRCRHGAGSADEYVRVAAERGLTTIAFTEHSPVCPELALVVPGAEAYAMPAEELPEYVAEVRAAQLLGSELGVEVLLGVEVDLDRTSLAGSRCALESLPLDVVLGSVHFVDDWAFDDPARTERYGEWRLEDLWERYFTDIEAAAKARIADVVAHADLVKKFTRAPKGAERLYRHAAEVFAAAGVAVEVNSAGLRKPCEEMYPSRGFLGELFRAGVPVTIGSDAHRPDELGTGLTEAVSGLRYVGYRSIVVFRGRVPEEVALDAL